MLTQRVTFETLQNDTKTKVKKTKIWIKRQLNSVMSGQFCTSLVLPSLFNGNFTANAFKMVQIIHPTAKVRSPRMIGRKIGDARWIFTYQLFFDLKSLNLRSRLLRWHLPVLRRVRARISVCKDVHGPEWRGATKGERKLHAAAWETFIKI